VKGNSRKPEDASDDRTTIERILDRRVLGTPPNLHNWIDRYGGYANITAEGWADYDRAMAEWRARPKP
jgi:hypothetical protein